MIKEITKSELSDLGDYELVDVREEDENEIINIGGTLIPSTQFSERWVEFPIDRKIVVYCRSGRRSALVIEQLAKKGYDNLWNLKGGIVAYLKD